MLGYLEYLDVPVKIGLVIVGCFLTLQIIGEFLEFKGKVVPEFLKIRKYFARKKTEKNEMKQTLTEVKQLLGDVNAHYSEDNITKRKRWIQWVNERAKDYDDTTIELSTPLQRSLMKKFPFPEKSSTVFSRFMRDMKNSLKTTK